MPLQSSDPRSAPGLGPLLAFARQIKGSSDQAAGRAVARFTNWTANHLSTVPGTASNGARAATMADVVYCYRLLLGRAPDEGGLDHYRGRLRTLTVGDLVEEFLGSVEFARRRPRENGNGNGASEVVETREGLKIHVDPTDFAVGHTVARTGGYEPEVSAALRRLLRPGQTFVDVGANIGWFSLLAASLVGPAGRVVAIEPNPANMALLRRSAKENGFDNIEMMTVALADEPRAVALETDGSNGRVIRIDGPPPEPVGASFVVAAQPLDTVLESAGVEHVDVMKIDVEGAEPMVLRGGAGTIGRDRPVMVSEFYPMALDCAPWGSAESYLAALRQLGYGLQVIGRRADNGSYQDDEAIMALATAPERDHVDLLAWPI